MKQVLQDLKSGETKVVDVPTPVIKPGHLLIRSSVSLISAGTERMLVEFSRANYLQKARQQPDRVRQAIEKAKADGIAATVTAVQSRLDEPQPLGYSNVGVVAGVGTGVGGFSVGDRVVSNGRHAELVVVPKNLCASVPDNVSDRDAAFTVVASIGLQGIRLLDPTLGESVVVYGLGLIGLLTVQMLQANGCRVLGLDLDPGRVALAREFGAEAAAVSSSVDPVKIATTFSDGHGVDGVILTMSTVSDKPIHYSAQMCRKRGRIVLVGVAGLNIQRSDFYEKELTFQVSCSYGPGRYDSSYEEKGQDYPPGFVRWTEQRNFRAVLDLLAQARLRVDPLVDRVATIDDAPATYAAILDSTAITALLEYPKRERAQSRTVEIAPRELNEGGSPVVVGFVGAGNFAKARLLPALQATRVELDTIASSQGLSSDSAARRFGFRANTNDVEEIFGNPRINCVFVATRHDSHARFAVRALESGRHVFVEKPLAINADELARVASALDRSKESSPCPVLMVGFNRRFAPLTLRLKRQIEDRNLPLTAVVTVNAGHLPSNHWTQDPEMGGGRIIGEACHFIDLLIHLTDSEILAVTAVQIGSRRGVATPSDKMTITLEFEDGSHGSIHYFANGHRSFPKERIEVFSDGRIFQIDNFRRYRGWGAPSRWLPRLLAKQDKGHAFAVAAFVDSIRNGNESPIPSRQLVNSAHAAIAAMESAQTRKRIELR